ncbi:hypothetical protein LIP_3186 [Limnochorda pilosa]|uniref:Uncharacterized protein n=1 Tax=Limnochorda pilosa TaxID=1555112 RepID=A0A0K2SQ99_LIMPI|nr:hypothetical protein LIP_3186 [Limnochorda pilosa]
MIQYEPWEGWSLGTPQAPHGTPLLDLLLDYVRRGIVPYHTPAHKQGRAAPPRLVDALGTRPFLIDLDGELGEPEDGRLPPAAAGGGPGRVRPARGRPCERRSAWPPWLTGLPMPGSW